MTYERRTSQPVGTSAARDTLMVGAPVYTADGDKLGEIKELRGSAFKVNAAGQPDYWLSSGMVSAALPERVVLSFPKDRLGDYKLDSPVQG